MKEIINIQTIENYRLERKLSISAFCKLCKIGYSTYKKIMNNNPNFGIVALFKIARVLKIQICELFYN